MGSPRWSWSRQSSEETTGWEDWANISSEILVIVIKKVQERAATDNAEMRRVVAMAGVCRSWRLAIQSFLALNPFSATGLLQFPAALREAGPVDKPVQCVMRRRGGLFFLYQSDCDSEHELRESTCNFLIGACKRWRPGHILFVLSGERRSFSQKSSSFMGKLRSNFWGTAFVLWDFHNCHRGVAASSRDGAAPFKKARPVTFVRFSEEEVDGVRQRKTTCVVRAPRPSSRGGLVFPSTIMCAQQAHGMNASCFSSPPLSAKALWKWSCMANLNKSIRSLAHSRFRGAGYQNLREEIHKTIMEEKKLSIPNFQIADANASSAEGLLQQSGKVRLRGVPGLLLKKGQKVAMFTGKIPEWDVQRQCWSLDFKGRATLPSMHNFQLLLPSEDRPRGRPADGESERRREMVVMQLGKIGKGLYALEFRYPLSAFQAFNIALSSFATTVGAEPS